MGGACGVAGVVVGDSRPLGTAESALESGLAASGSERRRHCPMIPLGLKETKPWAGPPPKGECRPGLGSQGFLVSSLTEEVRTQREGSDPEPPWPPQPERVSQVGFAEKHPGTDVGVGRSQDGCGSRLPALRFSLAEGCPSSQSLC